tara:strand:+ start:4738 stop:5430 length:693 start_codon:yes stop_codon:yes gene_type:complete
MKDKSEVSVIIRTKNEERWIGHTIQSVIDKLHRPEIIIVDNNSTDNTLQIVKSFIQDNSLSGDLKKNNEKYTNIKITNIDEYSPGKALNKGIKFCKNKYIMIISAHCVLNKLSLKKHIKDLEKFIAVFGNQIPYYYGKRITKRYIWSHFTKKRTINMYSDFEKRYFFHNAISFFKSTTLKKNPFSEVLTSKEDRYWINKQVKKNKNFLYDPEMEVSHYYTSNGNTWKGVG